MNFMAMNRQRQALLIAAVIGIISVFLPWVTMGKIFGESLGVSQNGFHGLGILAFLLFLAVGALSLVGDQSKPLERNLWMIALIGSGLALLCVIIKMANKPEDAFGVLKTGFGSWIALLASAAMLGAGWFLKNPGDTLQAGIDSLKKNMPSGNPSTSRPSAPSNGSSKVDELEKLIRLKDEGKITDEEYQQMKSKIM